MDSAWGLEFACGAYSCGPRIWGKVPGLVSGGLGLGLGVAVFGFVGSVSCGECCGFVLWFSVLGSRASGPGFLSSVFLVLDPVEWRGRV